MSLWESLWLRPQSGCTEMRSQLLPLTHHLQLPQPPLEIRPQHPFHAHNQAHRLADEILRAAHGPDHAGLIPSPREDEFCIARALERLHEIGACAYALVRLAFRDGHGPG